MIILLIKYYQTIDKSEALKLFNTTFKDSIVQIKSKREYEYRFKVFYENLLEIESQSLEPKLDHKGRPLIGFSRSSEDKSKGDTNATFEKAVNKFSFLTDKEFENMYLMSYDALFKNQKYLQQRQNPTFTFSEFDSFSQNLLNNDHKYEEKSDYGDGNTDYREGNPTKYDILTY